ncbi:lipoprotein-anchoring transpeptidase ErfK/SrfK [Sinorhizobium kostiense]|uniref:Lipoprotein-anchoring transpeptidase ErfK/SrfK n=1 Tax=Sinorhizobium kostiense TaxID=76747 RepID=A0ABS4R3N7_9HYPH|nr:L,D-transpeptidase [Sinorhizobium kostiense]MBP2237503.1 lipoprotein-anchoring transpeptidase ErfK/SrfK [Sinorhizobium kostiense]
MHRNATHARGWGRLVGAALLVLPLAFPSVAGAASARVPRHLGVTTASVVDAAHNYPAGTVVISSGKRTLDLVLSGNRALRYRIGVGRDGFRWMGVVKVGRKAEWPDWRPPVEMKARSPELPDLVPAGPFNPMGARGIYLYRGGADTLYRIHGTNEQSTVGEFASSGCFRMSNADVIDLYNRVKLGATVVVK